MWEEYEPRNTTNAQPFNDPQVRIQTFYLLFRVILAAVMICTKFNNDIYYSNRDFSLVCGISNAEINCIERYCLDILEFELFV